MSFREYFNEAMEEKEVEEEFDPKELERGIEVEREHKDIWDTLKTWADEHSLELPFTEEEFYAMVAKDHLKEIEDYYTRLDKMESEAGETTEEKPVEEAVSPEATKLVNSWKKKPKK